MNTENTDFFPKKSVESVMVKRMLNTLTPRYFYRQVAKAAKKS